MDYRHTRIWRIQHKLVVADTIEEAIVVYKAWAETMTGVTPTDITSIEAIGDNQIPENFDALIKS